MNQAPLTFGQALRYGSEAAAFLLFMGFFTVLGLDTASAVGGFMGRKIFARLPAGRTARKNLGLAYPEKSAAEIEAILTAMWDNLGRTVAEYAHLGKFTLAGAGARITIDDRANAAGEVASGRGVLFLSGHFANWEMMPIAAEQLGYEGAIVNRPPNNPLVARYIARQRALKGPREQIGKHHGTRRIFTLLRGGKAIFMLVDQKTNEGLPTPFFGRDAMTTPAPAALALKLGARILLASNKRLCGARFCVTVHPALEFEPSGDYARDVRDLTAVITARIEEMVRTDPSQWLWIHQRWPTERDEATGKRGINL